MPQRLDEFLQEEVDWEGYKSNTQRYLDRPAFKGTPLKGDILAEAAKEVYDETGVYVPPELALAQAQFESSMGRKGRSPETNPWNVLEFDEGTKGTFKDVKEGTKAYFRLMAKDYLNGKTTEDLLNNFVNYRGDRYASNPHYEKNLRTQTKFIKKFFEGESKNEKDITKDVEEQQKALINKGYNPGKVDGVYGIKTKRAIQQFQKDNGLKPDGIVGEKTGAKLFDLLSMMNPFSVKEAQAGEVMRLDEFLKDVKPESKLNQVMRLDEFLNKTDAQFKAEPEKNLFEKIKDKIGSVFKKSEEESIAEAQNIYAISKQTGIPLNEVEKNIEQLQRDSEITGISPDNLTNEQYTSLVFAPLIGTGLATAPVTTALSLGAFTAIDKMVNLNDFVPSDANDATKTAVELADFMLKGALVGGAMRGIVKHSPKVVEKYFQNKVEKVTKEPANFKLDRKQVRDIYNMVEGRMTTPEQESFLRGLQLDRKQIKQAVKEGIELNIPGERIVEMVDKPGWKVFKKLVRAKAESRDPLLRALSQRRVQATEIPAETFKQGETVKTPEGKPLEIGKVASEIPKFKSTDEAVQFGLKNKDKVEKLTAKREEVLARAKELRAKEDLTDQEFQEAMDLAVEAQFYREAIEVGNKEIPVEKSQEVLDDYNENIKPELEKTQQEIENVKGELSESEAKEVTEIIEEEAGNVEYDWEGEVVQKEEKDVVTYKNNLKDLVSGKSKKAQISSIPNDIAESKKLPKEIFIDDKIVKKIDKVHNLKVDDNFIDDLNSADLMIFPTNDPNKINFVKFFENKNPLIVATRKFNGNFVVTGFLSGRPSYVESLKQRGEVIDLAERSLKSSIAQPEGRRQQERVSGVSNLSDKNISQDNDNVKQASFEEAEIPKERVAGLKTEQQKRNVEQQKELFEKQMQVQAAKDEKDAVIKRIRKWRFNLNLKNYETNKFINELEQKTTEQEREVIPFLIEKTNVPEALGRPDLVEIYNTKKDQLQPLADKVQKHFEEGWNYIVRNTPNLTANQVENYVTHIWDIPGKRRSEVTNWFITRNKFLKKRFVETLKDGIEELGLKPKYLNISDIIRIHDNITNKTIANLELVNWLKKLKTSDGVPLIAIAHKAPDTWITIDHPALYQNLIIPGEGKMGEKVSNELVEVLNEMGVAIGRRIAPTYFGKPAPAGLYIGGRIPPEIRLQRFFKSKTVAHEIGHHLDSVLKLGNTFLNKHKDEIYRLNRDRIEAHKGVPGKYGQQYAESTEEQLAELFAFIFTDLNKALELAPNATTEALDLLKQDKILTKLVDFDFENKAKYLIEEQMNTIIKLPIKVHPDLEKPLRVVFDQRFYHPVVRGYEMVNGMLKKSMLSFSLFHHLALGETSIATMGLFKTGDIYFNPKKVYDAMIKGDYEVFKKEKIARKWIERGLQVGATQDIPVQKIQDTLNNFAKKTKNVVLVGKMTKLMASFNENWDKALWHYLHDTMKLYAAEHLGTKVDPNKDITKQEEEIAQMVNDTFGGQNWEALMISPKAQQMLGWLLLSPDWTLSTLRQAMSPLGVGAINKEFKKQRMKMGIKFWIKAALYFMTGINLLNYLYRKWDEKENPQYYDDKEKGFLNKTMIGNTIGHKTHLFAGRYEDGTERYIRWGKQFRELPEMFYDDTGFSPISASLKKMGGKTAPVFQKATIIMTGVSPSGFTNRDIYGKKGWQRVWGITKELGTSPLPFSSRTLFDKNKEFYITDIAMPASKGMTRYKAVELFQIAIEEYRKNGDDRYLKEVYQDVLKNNLSAYDLYKTALTITKSTRTKEINQDMKSIKDIEERLKEDISTREKDTLNRRLKRFRKEEKNKRKSRQLLDKAIRELEKLED